MSMARSLFQRVGTLLICCCLAGCALPVLSSATPTAIPTHTPILPTATPTAGTPQVSSLTAMAQGLGTFGFTLNASRTGISEVAITFASFTCGGVSGVSGEIDATNQATWPITSGQFTTNPALASAQTGVTITIRQGFTFSSNNGAMLQDITITGQFDGTGQHASGVWAVTTSASDNCPGTWQSA